ncbi:MAG: LysM domain-containing protein, partial [Candidatus Hydrogenedentota bacterium]
MNSKLQSKFSEPSVLSELLAHLLLGGFVILALIIFFLPVVTRAAETPSHSKTIEYTVRPGDTLYGIALRELGKGSRWKEIARLNKIPPPYEIAVGEKLLLPISIPSSPPPPPPPPSSTPSPPPTPHPPL